jgi:hypothetical protein
MTDLFVAYILGFLATASLAMAWFYSALPIHLTNILRWFGWHADDDEFWAQMWTWQQWADTINIWHPNLLSELLTCRICLSFHISFWVGLSSFIFVSAPFYYPLLTAVTWPILVNLALTKLNHE